MGKQQKEVFFLRLFCFLKIACLQWKGLKTNLQKLNLVSNFLFGGGNAENTFLKMMGIVVFFPQKRKAIILKFSYRKESLGKQVKPKELSVLFLKKAKKDLMPFHFFPKKLGDWKRLRYYRRLFYFFCVNLIVLEVSFKNIDLFRKKNAQEFAQKNGGHHFGSRPDLNQNS